MRKGAIRHNDIFMGSGRLPAKPLFWWLLVNDKGRYHTQDRAGPMG